MASGRDAAPPAYTSVAGPSSDALRRPLPEITILLLGSTDVGKSTFIANLGFVRNGGLQQPRAATNRATATVPSSSNVPNPSSFNVSLFNRPYKITIHRSTSTLFVDPFPEKINCAVFCYAIDDRASFFTAQKYWRRVFAERYEAELGVEVPLMLLGLKRDLRTDKMIYTGGNEQGEHTDGDSQRPQEYLCVMPEQGVRAANEMRCDRYAECSAVTGDLMFEALEDLTRMAAGTTTSNGGFAQGAECVLM